MVTVYLPIKKISWDGHKTVFKKSLIGVKRNKWKYAYLSAIIKITSPLNLKETIEIVTMQFFIPPPQKKTP